MKSRQTWTTLVGTLVIVGGAFLATAQMPTGQRSNNSETVTMTNNTHTITVASGTQQPLVPVSVGLTFKTPGTVTFTFDYVRGTYTNNILNRTITNCVTYVAFIPRDVKLIGSDQLVFTKSRADQAQLTINWK